MPTSEETTPTPTLSAAPLAGACPHCGSALLRMCEYTEDVYVGELRLCGDDLDQALATCALWATGLGNHDCLVGCARCDALLDEGDLVPARRSRPLRVLGLGQPSLDPRDSVHVAWMVAHELGRLLPLRGTLHAPQNATASRGLYPAFAM
jgi:hypothetical protein